MKASELRIGNWYENQDGTLKGVRTGKFAQIKEGKDLDFAQFMLPIPLTEEWLVKFGFKLQKDHLGGYWNWTINRYTVYSLRKDRFGIRTFDEDGDPDGITYFAWDIQFVHQLQNLYFALTGEELETK